MTMFQADRDQSAELRREIAHTRTTQFDAQARQQQDVAAYAHGRADELTRLLYHPDDPDRALSRAMRDLPNTRGQGKNYVLGEQSAAQFVSTIAHTGRGPESVCTFTRRASLRTLLGLRPAATRVEVLELTHSRSGIDAAHVLDTTGKTWWVRGQALRRLTVSAR